MASTFAVAFGFRPIGVTITLVAVYIALLGSIVVVHLDVPAAPKTSTPLPGLNLTEAWADLQELTNGYHPYNSKRNDEVRNWLLLRLQQIFAKNGATVGLGFDESSSSSADSGSTPVVLFNDLTSNLTFSHKLNEPSVPGISVYFESTNVVVYIRGSEDIEGRWWENSTVLLDNHKSGVLVNAHYDSVSTGYGATDDGMGVITNLQLASYFTAKGNTPKKGLVILFNNGEEDFLNGASVFLNHPVARFAHTFLNLEGAGAGGRATLFRASDSEVTRFYGKASHPYGTVVSADGFKRRLISSETDYVIFNGVLGMRGLDVAFWQPRARYHTDEDDTRHTSVSSLWHMLSSAVATVEGLTSDLTTTFESHDSQSTQGKLDTGRGSDGVWFDLYGLSLIVTKLNILFALSVSLLVLSPIITIALLFILYKQKKLYLFRDKVGFDDSQRHLGGWKGFFRFPIALTLSGAILIGVAFLINRLNPFIAYSSQFVVWSSLLSASFVLLWFFLNGAYAIRPSALQRGFGWLWLSFFSWLILILATAAADRAQVGSGYLIFIFHLDTFLASLITILELLALPKIDDAQADDPRHTIGVHHRNDAEDEGLENSDHQTHEEDENEPTERTSLLQPSKWGKVFTQYSNNHSTGESSGLANDIPIIPHDAPSAEQPWAVDLPSWTWILQLIIAVPFLVIIFGQVGLLLTTGLGQTGADGGATRLVYVATAIFSLMIILPISPFLHKVKWQIAAILLLVFATTLLYSLIAFPFSSSNRLKVYFIQEVDLDTSFNNVSITGVEPFVSQIAATIPSAARNGFKCDKSSFRKGLTQCTWEGLPPRLVTSIPIGVPPSIGYEGWLNFNTTRTLTEKKAEITVVGNNTRATRLMFDKPVTDLSVSGSATSDLFDKLPPAGATEIRLWSRTWETPWKVTVAWGNDEIEEQTSGLDGKVVGIWSDDNALGVIPALDEVRRYAPSWVGISKLGDGLVVGYKSFTI